MTKLWRLTLDTNPEDCNLNCIMCEEHSEFSTFKKQLFENEGIKTRRMPVNWIEKIFIQAIELGVTEIIPSTMGEPLLYSNIDEFFILAKKYHVKINLTTNGTFPKKNVVDWAKLIVPVTSDIKFSVNGATKNTAENIMRGLNFEHQINNIKTYILHRDLHFKKTNFYNKVTFQLTFMQNNMHEISNIIKLASEIGVDRIKGHHLWVHFPDINKFSFKNSKKAVQIWNKYVDEAKIAIEKYPKSNGEQILLEQFTYLQQTENEIVPYTSNCPFLGKELWISATGKISPCCAPDKLRDNLGDFGVFPETSLKDVLLSENYINLQHNYKQNDLCKKCVMRK